MTLFELKLKVSKTFTNLLLTNLDATGNSFSEISFTTPTYLKDTLILNLKLLKSQRRNIDKILVKGYDEFPEKFLKHFFNIDKSTVFSKKNMKSSF